MVHEKQREKRPANEGPARGVWLHILILIIWLTDYPTDTDYFISIILISIPIMLVYQLCFDTDHDFYTNYAFYTNFTYYDTDKFIYFINSQLDIFNLTQLN